MANRFRYVNWRIMCKILSKYVPGFGCRQSIFYILFTISGYIITPTRMAHETPLHANNNLCWMTVGMAECAHVEVRRGPFVVYFYSSSRTLFRH